MRIVHIANFYGPNSGGIKTTMHELGIGYLERGIDYVYIVPGTQLREEQTRYGTKLTIPGVILPGSGGYQLIRSRKALLRELARLQPDRIEISDRFTLLQIGRWAKAKSIPTVAFSHETLLGLTRKFLSNSRLSLNLVNWHNKRFSNSFDSIIATTRFAQREFQNINTANLCHVPLGVDLENFHPSHRSISLRSELLKGADFLIIHCSRLSPEKNPHMSIEAVRELQKMGISVRLVIIGMGPQWEKLRKLSAGLPIDFLGYVVDRKKVAAILSSADVTIAPGPLETFCLAAMESLASGTPVVASQSSAVGEFLRLDHRISGGLVAANSGVDFARKIKALLGRKDMRWAAREIAEQYPWEKTVERLLEIHRFSTKKVTI